MNFSAAQGCNSEYLWLETPHCDKFAAFALVCAVKGRIAIKHAPSASCRVRPTHIALCCAVRQESAHVRSPVHHRRIHHLSEPSEQTVIEYFSERTCPLLVTWRRCKAHRMPNEQRSAPPPKSARRFTGGVGRWPGVPFTKTHWSHTTEGLFSRTHTQHRQHATDTRIVDVVPRHVCVRALLPKPSQTGVHKRRIELAQHIRPHLQRLHHARPERLKNHVEGGDHPADNGGGAGVFQVETNRLLRGNTTKRWFATPHRCRLPRRDAEKGVASSHRAYLAAREAVGVVRHWFVHSHHLSAKVCQHHAAHGGRRQPCKFQDAQSSECHTEY